MLEEWKKILVILKKVKIEKVWKDIIDVVVLYKGGVKWLKGREDEICFS